MLSVYCFKNNNNILENNDHCYDTRGIKETAHLPGARKTTGQRSFVSLGQQLFNKHPSEIKQRKYPLRVFETRIRKWIMLQPPLLILQYMDLKIVYNNNEVNVVKLILGICKLYSYVAMLICG